MDFNAIKGLALKRSDEESGDTMIDTVVSDGVNEGYRLIASTVDKQIDTYNITSYTSSVTLPSNLLEVIEAHNGDVVLDDVDYYYTPNALIDDADVPEVDERYHRLIATYGAYKVMLYKKKIEMADRLIAEFDSGMGGDRGEL